MTFCVIQKNQKRSGVAQKSFVDYGIRLSNFLAFFYFFLVSPLLSKISPAVLFRWRSLLAMPVFYRFAQYLWKPLFFASFLIIFVALAAGLFWSPPDYQQGDAFRIIYVHVPCAAMSVGVYAAMACAALVYMIWHVKLADIIAQSLVPLGLAYCVCALVTGAVWGKPIWGAWWVWDARLTSELLLAFIYVGILLLREAYGSGLRAAGPCALLTLVGALNLPMIHYSVVWWHTLHQKATLLAWQKPTIETQMLWPLLGALLGFALLTLAWLCWRSSMLMVQREWRSKWVQSLRDDPQGGGTCHVV